MSAMTTPTTPSQQDDWKISKRARACSLCQRPFRSEEEHYSGIARVEVRFERRDVCLPCWTSQKPDLCSFWKTAMPKIEQKRFEIGKPEVYFDVVACAAAPRVRPPRPGSSAPSTA